MKHKNEIFETLSKIVYACLLLIVMIIITLGIELDFKKLLDWHYWVQVGTQLMVVMTVFNMVTTFHVKTKSTNENGRFYKAWYANKAHIEKIENNNLYDALTKAVEDENESIYIKECNNLLHSISYRLNYNQIIENIDDLSVLVEKYKIKKRRYKRRLNRIALKIYSGKVKSKKLKDDIFLRDKELNFKDDSLIALNTAKDKVKGNMIKMSTFLILSMFIQMLSTNFQTVNFWSWLITNLTLFISAVSSGFYEANREVRLRTAMYEERNAFLKRRLKDL